MHKNGLVKFIAILFTLISLLQISYTYVVNKIEKDAENYSITKVNVDEEDYVIKSCLLYTSPSPRDMRRSRMPSSA